MTEQLVEIGKRLRGLRDIMDLSAEGMAAKMKMSKEEYLAYEKGEKDFSFSFLYNAANALGVDVVDMISGETPKLTTCALVRNGEGLDVKKSEAYEYKHLAFTFHGKKAEPFMVTVEPQKDEKMTMHDHEGQEFVYMVSGKMEFHIESVEHILSQGDSVYFDGALPHAMKAAGNEPAKFISVVIK